MVARRCRAGVDRLVPVKHAGGSTGAVSTLARRRTPCCRAEGQHDTRPATMSTRFVGTGVLEILDRSSNRRRSQYTRPPAPSYALTISMRCPGPIPSLAVLVSPGSSVRSSPRTSDEPLWTMGISTWTRAAVLLWISKLAASPGSHAASTRAAPAPAPMRARIRPTLVRPAGSCRGRHRGAVGSARRARSRLSLSRHRSAPRHPRSPG